MPRIASGSLGEASPEEMICCTRLWFWFRSDCSSAYTLKAVMVCGSCTPVLRSLVCATWIRRTSSSTWLRPSSRLLQRGVECVQRQFRRAQRHGALPLWKDAPACTIEDILGQGLHFVHVIVAQPGQVNRLQFLGIRRCAIVARVVWPPARDAHPAERKKCWSPGPGCAPLLQSWRRPRPAAPELRARCRRSWPPRRKP